MRRLNVLAFYCSRLASDRAEAAVTVGGAAAGVSGRSLKLKMGSMYALARFSIGSVGDETAGPCTLSAIFWSMRSKAARALRS